MRQVCLHAFLEKSADGREQRFAQRVRFEGAGERGFETGESLGRKRVVASRLDGHQTASQTGKRERVVAHCGDVMLGLPDTSTLDAGASVQRIDDAPAEDVVRDRRRGDEEASRRPRDLGLGRREVAEEKAKPRAGGTKPSRRRQRKVELELVREQEHPVDRRLALEIEEPYGAELVAERRRPVVEDLGDRAVARDPEGEVQVGEAIALVDGERAHGSSGHDAVVLLRRT